MAKKKNNAETTLGIQLLTSLSGKQAASEWAALLMQSVQEAGKERKGNGGSPTWDEFTKTAQELWARYA